MQCHSTLNLGKAVDQALTRWAAVLIILGKVDKILLAESTFGLATRGERLRNEGADARLLARPNLFPAEVTSIGEYAKLLNARNFACTLRHARKLTPITANIGHLAGDDQMM